MLTGSELGISLRAPNCTVAVPHTRVHCRTPAGVGTGYQWMVSVAGRWSRPSDNRTGYAPPVVDSVEPTTVLTSGRTVTIRGSGFGSRVRYAASGVGGSRAPPPRRHSAAR